MPAEGHDWLSRHPDERKGSAAGMAGTNKTTITEFATKQPEAIRLYALHRASNAGDAWKELCDPKVSDATTGRII